MRKSLFFLFLFFVISFPLLLFGQNSDSLRTVIRTKGMHDTLRINAHYAMARMLVHRNADSAEFYASKGLRLSEKLNYSNGIGEGYGWMGYLCSQKGKVREAIDFNLKSLAIAEKDKLESEYVVILNNLATLNLDLKNYNVARSYYQKCVEYNIKAGNRKSLGSNYNNIGLLYKNTGEFPKAIDYLKRALVIRHEFKDKIGLSATYSNLGSVYENLDSTNLAMEYYQKSYDIRASNGYTKGTALSSVKLAHLLFQQGDFVKAKQFANEAYALAAENGFLYERKEAAKVLAEMLKVQGDYKASLDYFTEYYMLHDSIHSNENRDALIRSEYLFEYNAKHLKDSLEKDQVIVRNQLLRGRNNLQRSWLIFTIVFSCLLIILLFAVRKNARIRMEKLRSDIKLRLGEILKLRDELNVQKELNESGSNDVNVLLEDKLTTREQEVMEALILGLSNKEIGEKLFLSVNTVKTHVNSLYVKLDVNNRTQAAIKGSMLKNQN